MLDDDAFMKSWQSNSESESDKAIIWRRYILSCAAYHCIHLEGDFVECGAYTGVGVKTIVDYLGGTEFPKQFWAYDLFEHDATMLHHAMPEHSDDLHAKVMRKFAAYPQVRVLKGKIPEVFDGQSPGKIAYLHIDLNEAPAEIAAQAVSATLPELNARLSALQLVAPSLANLYSLQAGRIDFIPYQFRPVLKFIRADRPRLPARPVSGSSGVRVHR